VEEKLNLQHELRKLRMLHLLNRNVHPSYLLRTC